MKKNKFKLVLKIICFLLINIFFFNYIVFDNLNFGSLNSLSFLFEDNSFYQYQKYGEEFIEDNQNVTSLEPNAVGTAVHTYHLEIDDVPENIAFIKLSLDDAKSNANNKVLQLYLKDEIITYNQDDIYIENGSDGIIIINRSDVDKIVIESVFEQYGVSNLINPEILSIDYISFNDNNDFSILKSNLLVDLLKSILITVMIYLIYLILFHTKIDKKMFNKDLILEKVFFKITIIVGILFSVLFPLYQIPDELTHINMIYSDLNMEIRFEEITENYGDTNRIIRNYDEKVDLGKYFDFNEKLEITDNFEIPSILFIRHFPQTVGLILGSILELPIIVCITLSEVMAVLFYSYICSKSLKLMPFKKEMMMLVMLLPICIQQMGSFSYDSILLPICFLFISYVFYLKFVKEKIKLGDVIKLFLMLGIISLIKVPYILLGGLVILLPVSKISLDFKFFRLQGNFIVRHKIKFLIGLSLLVVIAIIVGILFLKEMSYGRILLGSIKASISTIHLLANSVSIYGWTYLKELTGDFGWFDTPVSILFTIFVLFNMLFIAFYNIKDNNQIDVSNTPFKKWELVYLFVLGIFMCAAIILSMFEWTIYATGVPNASNLSINEYCDLIKYSIPVIGGVQGRYFLPIIPLFLVILYSKKISKFISRINWKFYLLLYYVIIFTYMFFVVLNRYWI